MQKEISKSQGTVCGVGIDDTDYPKRKTVSLGKVNGKKKDKVVWWCPFYVVWTSMIKRGFSKTFKNKEPTYQDCTVCDDWLYSSKFKSWMETQSWEGNHLDKDILFPGNKIYSPETCVFVSGKTNLFVLDSGRSRGQLPIGVTPANGSSTFVARCQGVEGKPTHIGTYKTPELAHTAWLSFKLEQAYILAARQADDRVAKALIDRYENYSTYFACWV